MGLIELLKDFTDSQYDNALKQNALLERCLNASTLDLERLSLLLNSSPNTYLPTLQIFMSRLCNKNMRTIARIKRQNTRLSDFTLLFITIIVMKNLHHSDIPTFRELLYNCIELLWLIGNKNSNKLIQELKKLFSKILDVYGVLGILVSDASSHFCLERMLFEFKIIDQIEQEELLKAVDVVAALVGKCSEHKKDLLPKCLSEYEACTELWATLKSRNEQFGKRWNKVPLSAKDKQHIALLNVVIPQRPSGLLHFLKALERQKINLFQNLLKFLPCASCYKQALVSFSPDKYFLEEESVPSFRLPFEFNEDDRLGPWDVLLSDDTIEDMRSMGFYVIKAVMNKLGHLSSGAWGMHKLQCIAWNKYQLNHTVPTCAIPAYEVELPDNGGLKILWSVDYGFSIRNYSLTQLVKIWAITSDQKQIRKILQNLSIVHQVYTSKQSHRCVVRQIGKDDQIGPTTFDDEDNLDEIKTSENNYIDNHNIDDDRLLEVHKMLVTNKFVPLSKNLFNSLVLGGLKFTFQISKKEYEIINSPTSSIIIGRSGTGKTTCIKFRMITSYLNKQLCKTPSICDNNNKRQIFITVSPVLCCRVRDDFYKLRKSAMLAGKKMTMSQYWEYKRMQEEEGIAHSISIKGSNEDPNVPNSFHQLTDHHFPLFITYDKFSKMLLETYGINSQNLTVQQKFYQNNINSYDDDNQNSYYNKYFVNYKVFQKRYWPSLNEYCKKKFDCGLVYSEFSIIKGSNPDVDYLSREDYRDVSFKKYPVFSYSRDQIYDLFEHYEKLKSRNGDYDSIDRTLAILRCAKTKALGGPHVHEVYIDECQDNQIVDLALILKLFDHAGTVFFAGDIAQCIAQGSSFRFQDLRALIYHWECTRRIQANRNQYNIKPQQFELNINYRCHHGVLQLASSVIDLISHFFPNSIDRLSRERGEVIGPQPIIYDGFQEYHFKVFSANDIEFGAEQVIIVRDDEAKLHLKKIIGRAGLILTIFEAKGMEFDDVLLYNFFNNSPACNKWRVIHSAISENSKGIQVFSHEKHYILSSELKHLYVAITRARQKLWICDENIGYSMPIRKYWNKLVNVINVTEREDKFLSDLVNGSSSYEWDRKGKEFFEQQKYEQAIFCFKKSGNDENYKLANAYYLLQIARDSRDDPDENIIKSNFIHAAQAFLESPQPIQAALCYQEIGMIEEAGKVYIDLNMFEPAARCYLKIKMWHKAGKCFVNAKKYADAAFAYMDGDFYDTSINLIQQYRQEIDEDMFLHIINHIKIHYRDIAISYGKFEEAIDIFIRLIDNNDDVIEALQFLLYLYGIDMLKVVMTDNKSLNISQKLLFKKSEIITKFKSESLEKCDQWKSIIEKFQLYSAYLKKDFNRIHECIEFFRSCRELVNEFHAIIIWLHFPQSDIQAKYWYDRLQYLLKVCELAFPFINSHQKIIKTKIHKDIDDIFFINEVEDVPQKRQIPFGNQFHFMYGKNKKITEEITNKKYICDVNDVHQKISQFLVSYIFKLIQDVNQRGRNIPDISFQICDNFASCEKLNCQKHHVVPTPLILYKRLTFACLQYTVIQQLDVLYNKLPKNDQNKIFDIQRWWVENLVDIHICYQSSQTSCPEIIYIALAKLPRNIRGGFINTAHKIWLLNKSKYGSNFAVILKCIFVFQQLQDKANINKFYLEMSKITMLSHPINLLNSPVDSVISVEKRLSLFFFFLNPNQVTHAILHVKKLIQYIINNIQLDSPINTFGDLVSLMEFKISLVLAAGHGCCDFCLPRAYLVNYFEAFTAKPLISNKSNYSSNENYLAAIKNSFDQVQHLLDLLISKKKAYFTIILRLLRLLVLIGLNESTFALKVFNIFKRLNNQIPSMKAGGIFSVKIKKYLQEKDMKRKDTKEENEGIEGDMEMEEKDVEERDMEYLVKILHNDLKETGCDSLIIVHNYQQEGLSRFSNLEKYGIMKLSYNSVEEFHSALQQIILSVINEQVAVSEESQALTTEIQVWFHSRKAERVENAAKKIQTWFRQNQKKLNSILNRVYNEMMVFCRSIMKEKGKEAVYKYNILLRGLTVDMIVELMELQSKMDIINNNNPTFYDDDVAYDYCEKVNLVLESLSVTKNLVKHKKVNIEWLENELKRAKGVIDHVWEWIRLID